MLLQHYSRNTIKSVMTDNTKNEYCTREKAVLTNSWSSLEDKSLDFYACGIEDTLFVTDDITKSSALFIRSADETGKRVHIVFDMDGVVSLTIPARSNELRAFLRDPIRTTYKLLNSSLGECDSGIESIEFEKQADASTNVSLITARLLHSDARAMTGVAQRIQNSQNPFTDAMSILDANIHTQRFRDRKPLIDITEQPSTTMLSRWLDLAKVSGLIQEDELTLTKSDINKDEHTLNVKYIMIVLRKALVLLKEELAQVVCVGKRKFECPDIDELFRLKDESQRPLYDFSLPVQGFGTVPGKTTMRQVGCPIQ